MSPRKAPPNVLSGKHAHFSGQLSTLQVFTHSVQPKTCTYLFGEMGFYVYGKLMRRKKNQDLPAIFGVQRQLSLLVVVSEMEQDKVDRRIGQEIVVTHSPAHKQALLKSRK